MKINEEYKVETIDLLNVALLEKRIVKEGKNAGDEVWQPVGYYVSVKSALKGLVEREIFKTGLKDLETVCNKIDELFALIDSLEVE